MNRLSRFLGAVRNQFTAYVPRVSVNTQAVATESPKKEEIASPAVKIDESPLAAFFDSPDNWKLNEIRVGRSWRKEELRIKSNQDLHKLWFVLLKERNMLLTMQHELIEQCQAFPSPERIDKVHESMVNLEEVVRERNRAYYMLETGETGERPGKLASNRLGMHYFYKYAEHVIPPEYNGRWFQSRQLGCNRREVAKFRLYMNEKIWMERKRAKRRETQHVMRLYKYFPNLDEEAVRADYPDVDLSRVKRWKGIQGHCEPREDL